MNRLLFFLAFAFTCISCRYSNTQETEKLADQYIPQAAYETLAYIQEHNKAPQGYVGGRKFRNFERLLPAKAPNGEKIQYKEWDIYPKIEGRNRGAERLVTSSDGLAYFTPDHYKSFIIIQQKDN